MGDAHTPIPKKPKISVQADERDRASELVIGKALR